MDYGETECVTCGLAFKKKTRKHKYCSKECYGSEANKLLLWVRDKQKRSDKLGYTAPVITPEQVTELKNHPCTVCGAPAPSLLIRKIRGSYSVDDYTSCCVECRNHTLLFTDRTRWITHAKKLLRLFGEL